MKIVFSFLVLAISLIASVDDDYEYNYLEGKQIYEQTCVSCHGSKGIPNDSMNLVVKPRDLTKTILNKEQIYKVVRDGAHAWGSKSDIMPSFKSVYRDEELQNVALYVFDTFTAKQNKNYFELINQVKDDKTLSLKRGEKIFKRNCSLCHGIRGDGESEFVEKSSESSNFIYPYNLTKIILNEDQIYLYSKFGGKFWGTHKNDMPSWKTKYSDNDLRSVARYIIEKIQKSK